VKTFLENGHVKIRSVRTIRREDYMEIKMKYVLEGTMEKDVGFIDKRSIVRFYGKTGSGKKASGDIDDVIAAIVGDLRPSQGRRFKITIETISK